MGTYLLVELKTGDRLQVDRGTVERLLGIEISYIDWALETDGVFENGTWRVRVGTHAAQRG